MVTASAKPIAARVSLSRRYVRSTDVMRDLGDPSALDGYIMTSAARSALQRLAGGLSESSTQRAFRITGPYGSGKSSFALLLCRLASGEAESRAREIVHAAGIPQAAEMARHDVMVMGGRRTSFARDLLAAVQQHAEDSGLPEIAATAGAALAERDAGLTARSAVQILSTLAEATLAKSGRRTLLVIDEMGRYVEHAAANPRTEDPSVFQQLAEKAGGRSGAPLAVVGILHHRFAEYVVSLGGLAEAEWTRSAERYEEIPFGDSLEQTLHLVAGALRVAPKHVAAVENAARKLYQEAFAFGALTGDPSDAAQLAPGLYPLHPAALSALTVAARRLGQNERSIFGFLQTLEPGGFQRFVQDTDYGPASWYRLPRLFDYFAAQGSIRFGSADRERRWHLALDAIAQVDPGSIEADVVRSIALLAVLEPVHSLRATAASLAWSLGIDEALVEEALEALSAKGLVYRRPQSGDYSLWSRSSVDLDHWLEEARIRVPVAERLDQAMASLPAPRPLVAHAHYQRSGTLRAFAVQLRSSLDDAAIAVPSGHDGTVAVLAAHPQDDMSEVAERALRLSQAAGPRVLVHIHRVLPADLEWANRLRQWRWVSENCAELRMDDLARAEVSARLGQARAALADAFAALASPEGSDWVHEGREIEVGGRGALSRRISAICDKQFRCAPVLRNELVNRSKLSTAVASARMRLLETMIEKEGEAMLGMTGAPPERTIHLAMFAATGMHREVRPGEWRFMPPEADHRLGWRPVWDRLGELLEGGAPVPFTTIAERLAEAPWGLRAGPSLLLVTAFMLHHRTEIALMERNSFVPELTGAHFMRLAKNPGHFALRAIGGDDERTEVLERLAAGLTLPADVPRPAAEVKSIVEALYRWFGRLPENARITGRATSLAQAVRTALAKARDPLDTLFDQLPRACRAVRKDGRIDAALYVESLSAAIQELADVDPTQRRLAAASLASAFGQRDAAGVRTRIEAEFGPLRDGLTDYPLRQFVDRALGGDKADDRWLDGIAGLIAGRRIENWNDGSLDTFSFKTREMAGRLSRWLFLKEREAKKRSQMVSLHMMTTSGEERAVVVEGGRVDPEQIDRVRRSLADVENPAGVLAELLAELMDHKEAKAKA
ncbi:hypothetical protein SOM26_03475 [Sphingomonas sp. CFBP8993]|uniref:hypothetical protein n=1 Tax=Sphingomonas sp. CFBP8993 TaxID=3096526 RepID=UPI002A6AFE1F|nr:hypothetical protein [Sphingomonas sp. CFBP8993]MDY0957741.1 hypothetical protein [Sphingomonas sp. CFBP8993]